MEEQITEILMQHYRALALAAAGLIFLIVVNRTFRKLVFQGLTTILLLAGVLISYALITDHPATREFTGKVSTSLAMAESDHYDPRDQRPSHVIR